MKLFHYEIISQLKRSLGNPRDMRPTSEAYSNQKTIVLFWANHNFSKSLKISDDWFELTTSSSRLSSHGNHIALKSYEATAIASDFRIHRAQLREIFGRTDLISNETFVLGLPAYIEKVLENEKNIYFRLENKVKS